MDCSKFPHGCCQDRGKSHPAPGPNQAGCPIHCQCNPLGIFLFVYPYMHDFMFFAFFFAQPHLRIIKYSLESTAQCTVIKKIHSLSEASLGISPKVVKLLAYQNSRVVKRPKLGFCYTYIQNSRVVN